jgi:hypothetical protein
LVTSTREISVFQNPWSTEPIASVKPVQGQVLSKVGNRIMLRGSGWINVDEVTSETFKPRGLFSLARKVFGDDVIVKLKRKVFRQIDASYTILARR